MSPTTGSVTGFVLAGGPDVLGPHRVAVHRRVVEPRQRRTARRPPRRTAVPARRGAPARSAPAARTRGQDPFQLLVDAEHLARRHCPPPVRASRLTAIADPSAPIVTLGPPRSLRASGGSPVRCPPGRRRGGRRPQVVASVAGVIAPAAEDHAVHRLAGFARPRSASVSWSSPPRPGRRVAQDVEDPRREDVAADDREVARRVLRLRLLHQVGDPDDPLVVGAAGRDAAVHRHLARAAPPAGRRRSRRARPAPPASSTAGGRGHR